MPIISNFRILCYLILASLYSSLLLPVPPDLASWKWEIFYCCLGAATQLLSPRGCSPVVRSCLGLGAGTFYHYASQIFPASWELGVGEQAPPPSCFRVTGVGSLQHCGSEIASIHHGLIPDRSWERWTLFTWLPAHLELADSLSSLEIHSSYWVLVDLVE